MQRIRRWRSSSRCSRNDICLPLSSSSGSGLGFVVGGVRTVVPIYGVRLSLFGHLVAVNIERLRDVLYKMMPVQFEVPELLLRLNLSSSRARRSSPRPLPSTLAISGSFLGPNSRKAMNRMKPISSNPLPNTLKPLLGIIGGRPRLVKALEGGINLRERISSVQSCRNSNPNG